MTTVEDLYYGNIAPYERYIRHGSREKSSETALPKRRKPY